jgi:hypothetical protein
MGFHFQNATPRTADVAAWCVNLVSLSRESKAARSKGEVNLRLYSSVEGVQETSKRQEAMVVRAFRLD